MQKEDNLKYFVYNPSQPIDTISIHVGSFENLYELVQDIISDRLKTWNRKKGNLKIYALMKKLCAQRTIVWTNLVGYHEFLFESSEHSTGF